MIFLMNYTELILNLSPKTTYSTPSIIEELGNINVDMLTSTALCSRWRTQASM